jgi:NAD-dependent deacetylase
MKSKKKLVVFTGAGISAESGIQTFRGGNGLWENYKIEDVATPQAWQKNKDLVLDFYNQRRIQVLKALPNAAHKALVTLEQKYDVHIITQNIDDLHERAGSKQVLHLHGEIRKSRSTANPQKVYEIKGELLQPGDMCELGSQLRPHIVWFGEIVPMMDTAEQIVAQADVFLVIGTSLQVYPAASLLQFVPSSVPCIVIDPHLLTQDVPAHYQLISDTAAKGLPLLADKLLSSIDS